MDTQKAKNLAIELMEKHNLIREGWRFQFDNAKSRFGCCKYYPKLITLSRKLVELNEEDKVVDTILHEIAHALTPGEGHNEVWRKKAIEIGSSGNRCYSVEVVSPESKYIAKCKNCGFVYKREKMAIKNSSCGKCSRTYDHRLKLEWVLNPNN